MLSEQPITKTAFGNKLFTDHKSLIENLKEKSKNYPLIARLYLPIIEKYAKKYLDHEIEDWLCIPYFEFLYRQDAYGIAKLNDIEKDLQQIYKNIGGERFKELCSDLIPFVAHPVINGIHDKLFDFYAELQGMLEFIKKGYSIERIKRSNKKASADLRAIKPDGTCIVECKFIHASNRIKTFIKRYTRFLSIFCPEYKGNYGLATKIDIVINSKQPHELTQDLINIIKNFIKEIIYKKLTTHEITLHYNVKGEQHSCKITYKMYMGIGLCTVTIQDQLNFVEQQLEDLNNTYISRLIKKASDKQLANATSNGESTCLFICIQLDEHLSPPWEGIDSIKNKIFGKDANVIIKDASGLV
jgi:hypothetical protein